MVCVSGGDIIYSIFTRFFYLPMKNFLQYLISDCSKKDLLRKYSQLKVGNIEDKVDLDSIITSRYKNFLAIKSLYREFIWKYNYYELASSFKKRCARHIRNEIDYHMDLNRRYFYIRNVEYIIEFIRTILKYNDGLLSYDNKRAPTSLRVLHYALPEIIKRVQKQLDLVDFSPHRYDLSLLNWKITGDIKDVTLVIHYICEKR